MSDQDLPAQAGGDISIDMEARVARLEASVSHIERDVGDLRANMRDLRSDVAEVRDRLSKILERLRHLPTSLGLVGGGIVHLLATAALFIAVVQLLSR